MAKYLISGGAGFIGSNTVEKLLRQGEDVVVLDDFSTGSRRNLDALADIAAASGSLQVIEGDVRSVKVCRQALQGADYVIHLAAIGSVARSVDDPITTSAVNIEGTLNMLTAAQESGIKRFVYASSSSVYGDNPTLPKHEEMPPAPLSPYAVSKLAAEYYCRIFYRLHRLPTVSLRYFNVFGKRQSRDSVYAAVIPGFCARLFAGKQPVIFGDGKQSRDFTYIDNVATANLLACRAPEPAWGGVYNIATGAQINLLELSRELAEIFNRQVTPVFDPPRPGDVKHSRADISRAKEMLGYSPEVDFREGLRRTVEWYRDNPNC